MSLSNATKTHLIDPRVHNSARCEFRLDDAFWSSSLRLVDLGVYDSQITGTNGLFYPAINGVMASVKKLTLYSGGTVIDEMQELPSWASIQHLRTTNQGSEDINRFELLNGMGLSFNNDKLSLNDPKKDYTQRYANSGTHHPQNQFKIAAEADDKTSGAVTLSDYLGLLQSSPVLPRIPNLKLIIDWNTNASAYYQDPDAPAALASPSYVPIRPTLIAEEILGMEQEKSDFKLPFLANIVERHVVPAIATGDAAGTSSRSSFRSSAFKNRYVKDLTFFNKANADSGFLRAAEHSPVQQGEILQLVVNGAKYLPDQGITQPSQKLQYFNDTHGSLNLPAAAFYMEMTDASGRVLDNDDHPTNPTSDLASNYSVTAVRVEDTVERLDIEYTREKSVSSGTPEPTFTLLAFGRCAKQLEVKNGICRISY